MSPSRRDDRGAGQQDVARRGPWRRVFAWAMAHWAGGHEERLRPWKERLMEGISGDVLEIGAGAGANLTYLPQRVRYVAIEPNVHMHAYLRERAARRGIALEVRAATAESLPAPDASFDAVVSTLVLCSVGDVDAVLTEVLRVLRPGGRFLFVEHVAAPAGTRRRCTQRLVRPLWSRIGDGCEPDRELGERIRAAGFAAVEIEEFETGVPIVGPHIAGAAHAPGGRES